LIIHSDTDDNTTKFNPQKVAITTRLRPWLIQARAALRYDPSQDAFHG